MVSVDRRTSALDEASLNLIDRNIVLLEVCIKSLEDFAAFAVEDHALIGLGT